MKVDPNWSALPQNTPASIRKLVRRCLTKDRKQRLQAIGEARIAIEEHLANPQREAEVPRRAEAPASKWPWILAAVGIAAALLVSFLHFREARPEERVQRYTITLPENTTSIHSFAISPDGRYLAIAAVVNGHRELWLRPLDALQAQPMSGTEDASFPFWSPDSRYIGFFAQGKLKKIAAKGGPAQYLCDAPYGGGGSWNRDNVIVFSPNTALEARGTPIQRVFADGGVPADIIGTKGNNVFPVFLPDGRHVLYRVFGLPVGENGVYLSSLDGKVNRRVLSDASSVAFAAGRLLFIRENTLMAQPFDAASGQTMGEAFPVDPGVSSRSLPPFSVSETGLLLLYQSGGVDANNQMAWYDRGGKLLGTVGSPGLVMDPAISPDEKSVVFRRQTRAGADLWLRDLTREVEQRFTSDASFNRGPIWSPQGDRIVFTSNRGGALGDLYQKAASGTGQDELLLATGPDKVPTQWSRDSRFIVYMATSRSALRDIWVLPMEGGVDRKPSPQPATLFLHSESSAYYGQLSPDSHWMAYTSDESGQPEVYVRPFPGGEFQQKISIAGGEQPRWRGDGKELFFLGEDGKMMAVAVRAVAGTKPSFEPATPQPLFEAHLASGGKALFEYDVTADGKRFLVNTSGGSSASPPVLTVEVNWDAGMKK
jgi:Tol biopolymer transport system component